MKSCSSRNAEFGAAILAAGRSSRMGRPKMLLPWGGTSVIGHLIAQWSRLEVGQLAIVCAAGDAVLGAELDLLGFAPANRISNPAPDSGMFGSLQCAASWPGWRPGLTHWALILGDQPHLRLATLIRLLEFARHYPAQVCQPASSGHPRHPVVVPKAAFSALATSCCGSLKEFLRQYPAALWEVDDPGLDLDLDRPEDYERAWNKFRPAGSA